MIRDDEVIVDADDPAEAAAGLACAQRRIEAERARIRLLVCNVAIRAVQVGGEAPRGGILDRRITGTLGIAGTRGVTRARIGLRVDVEPAVPDLERRLDGIGGA